MKQNSASKLELTVVLCMVLAALPAVADDVVDRVPILSSLYAAPMPELAATAVKLVKAATNQLVEPTVREVVRDSIRVNRLAAVSVVGGIASAKPEMASVAAGTAAALVPELAVPIAKAATVSVPPQAGRIVQVVCEAAPKQYRQVALVVARVAPDRAHEILDGLAMALPNLKIKLMHLNSGTVSTNSVETILRQIEMPAVEANDPPAQGFNGTPVAGPAVVQPLIGPYVGSGGRNYSRP